MGNIAPSFLMVNPNYIEPGLLLPYVQASGAFETIAEGQPLVRLSEGDLYAYIKRIDLRNRVNAGQSAYNSLPSVSTALSMILICCAPRSLPSRGRTMNFSKSSRNFRSSGVPSSCSGLNPVGTPG